jgi:hypothetical protein
VKKQVSVAAALATAEKLGCNPGCHQENHLSYYPIASEKQVSVAAALATGENLSCNPHCNRENYLSYNHNCK